MRILEDRFCNLSRAKDFQVFLKGLDSELYQKLINHLQLNENCSSNKSKMKVIYKELKERHKEQQLLNFMFEYYPHMVVKSSPKKNDKKEEEKTVIKQVVATSPDELYTKMNYHKVFDIYRPKILFIPQRKIFIGPDKKYVLGSINQFTTNKLDVDFIILQGPDLWHGYVEYFDLRFRDHIKTINHSQRPIFKYRANNGLR